MAESSMGGLVKRKDLSGRAWELQGWRPFAWQLATNMELGLNLKSDVPAMPARVPGSAQTALRDAGWIPDWNRGLDSLKCEWVEHRQWEFSTAIESGEIPRDMPVVLCADGLDYSGWILVDGKIAAKFKGALLRHRFDLTPHLGDGRAHRLSIMFDEPPQEQGQIGFTSQSQFFKPRYNYSWDWCPRLVPVGIWDAIWLEVGARQAEVISVSTSLAGDLATGAVQVGVAAAREGAKAVIRLSRKGREVAATECWLRAGENRIELAANAVEPWWPNGHGAQPLYDLQIEVDGVSLGKWRVGFKRIQWRACEDAPKGALPWICEVNGKAIFLQGVNWTPMQLDYHADREDDYRKLIALYVEMGCNLLRVWGGGYLERKVFYDLCDEAGLMVWQEFPLSSSGADNWPPESTAAIEEVSRIARDMIRRRRHHVSLTIWCGGNELQHAEGKKTGAGIPVTTAHPCIAALARVVEEESPEIRFLPTSSSGPRFMAEAADFGKGLHHDVHGPWSVKGEFASWQKYWAADDALFRSETGAPGAASRELIKRHCGESNPWPPSERNPYWLHISAWWLEWDRFGPQLAGLSGSEGLEKYVALSQALQRDALRVAAQACRDRFPRCGGFLVWMGHDAFPCPINTAVIDFERRPKPAYFALKEVFCGR